MHSFDRNRPVAVLVGLFLLGVVAATAPATGVSQTEDAPTTVSEPTIVDIAVSDGRFTTLVAALDAAGLVETLQGEGPFTVFAPTDDAFARLPAGTIDALLADIPTLTGVLLYHVVADEVPSSTVVNLTSATTVQGQPVIISTADGVAVNGASVVIPDIRASNGIIHAIDTVILPPTADIVETAVADGRFTTLVAAVQAAGLVETLQGEGPFTVFAPTDDAFASLPEGTVESLLDNIPALTDVLTYHVVAGRVFARDVVGLTGAPSVQGSEISIAMMDGSVRLNGGATVVITDILTTNGVIHVIDAVILPPS